MSDAKPIKAIVVAEGEFCCLVELPDAMAMKWYEMGLSEGADAYGSGSCLLLTASELTANDYPEHHDLIRQHLGG